MARGVKILRVAALAVAVCAGLSLLVTARSGVESDLLALIGPSAGGGELKAASSSAARSARILVRADSATAARARLKELGCELPDRQLRVSPLLRALEPYAGGFLSQTVRRQLEHGEFAAVRDAAIARLFSPMPPIMPPDRDPFLLFTDYAMELSGTNGEWTVVDAELSPSEALAVLAAVKGADDVRCAGAPFHTAVASENSKREINALSAISILCVVLFGWLLTRSLRFIPVLLALLAAAFCVATAALFAVFPRPHLVTFVFGTTLIGLGVDYVYHSLAARESIARPLTFSFLSTAACFLPLMFSGVGAMRQMAVFTIAGLATVYAGVLLFATPGDAWNGSPGNGCASAADGALGAWRRRLLLTLLAAIVFVPLYVGMAKSGACQKGFDLSRLYRPDPYLAEGERLALEATGGADLIPSAEEQRRNMRLVRRLYAAEGRNLCAMTGLPERVLALPGKFEAFDPKGALERLFGGWRNETDRLLDISILVLCCVLAVMFRGECLDFILPVLASYAAVSGLLMCMGESLNFFARICFFLFIGLGLDYCVFRWHARRHQHRQTGRAVWYSFLTSLAAFGLLGFTGFAVTRLMGITLAAGLAVAYFAAKVCAGLCRGIQFGEGDAALRPWHEQKEQCASRFWVLFMWYSYAWFGKSFQKAIFVVGMPFIYLFARPPRLALRTFYGVLSEYTGRPYPATHGRLFRHLLGFAWGLMDKTDASTLKKNPPRMTVRDDAGWRAFKALTDAGRGAFVLCTHVGVVGVLPALPAAVGAARSPKVHAFQQMGHDAVFMRVFMRHFDSARLELHAVEDIGVGTAVEMQAAIRRGELVIMAGDRTSAGSKGVLKHRFLGRECAWPKGAFKFAKLMEAPVFGVTCIRTGWNSYEVHVAALADGASSGLKPAALLDGYVAFLERETLAHPDQWYQFYDFFQSMETPPPAVDHRL